MSFWIDQIVSRIFPRQKWLTDKIGRHWKDKDEIIEICVFGCMIHYWEDEGGEREKRFQYEHLEAPCGKVALDPEKKDAYEKARQLYFHLDKCYGWAKYREKAWSDFYDNPSEKREQELIQQDTLFMQEIIHFRDRLWT